MMLWFFNRSVNCFVRSAILNIAFATHALCAAKARGAVCRGIRLPDTLHHCTFNPPTPLLSKSGLAPRYDVEEMLW